MKHIFSYLKKRLEAERLIHKTKDNDFMKIIYDDMELINETDYRDYKIKNKRLDKAEITNKEKNFFKKIIEMIK